MSSAKSAATLGAAVLVLVTAVLVFVPTAWATGKFRTLHQFNGENGGRGPGAGLILDQAGNLYGTTAGGGFGGAGTVFKLAPRPRGGWEEQVLYSFCAVQGCTDGYTPQAGLAFDQAGNLYGTTYYGGTSCFEQDGGCGVVFKLTPHRDGSWTESVLYTFCPTDCSDGAWPRAGLTFDQAGNLYGEATVGGANGGGGAVFKLAPKGDGSWTESVLYSFCSLASCGDGSGPAGGLIFDQSGDLYGTTIGGGLCNDVCGVVFKLTSNAAGSWTESVLHGFCSLKNCSDGSQPLGGLILDQAGSLYGTTFHGGSHGGVGLGNGVVFKLTSNQNGSWQEEVLRQFTGDSDGAMPEGSLILDQAENLYGTTTMGGNLTCSCGVVFKLALNSRGGWHETVLHNFLAHPGKNPTAGVILDSMGNLYGTTAGDGIRLQGSVFEITP